MSFLNPMLQRIHLKVCRFLRKETVFAIIYIWSGSLPARGDELTGDYQVMLNEQKQKSVMYRCNSLNVYANSGGSLSGDLICNALTLTANGGARVAFEGNVTKVDVHLITGMSKVYMNELTIGILHIEMVNDRSVSYFKVAKSAQVDLVNGQGMLYIRAADSGNLPTVHVNQINGNGEIHWCNVNVQADSIVGGGQMIEDCSW